jgi:hypothetical protein
LLYNLKIIIDFNKIIKGIYMSHLTVNNQSYGFTSVFSYLSDKLGSAFSWIKTAVSELANRFFSCRGEAAQSPSPRSLSGRVDVREIVTSPNTTVTASVPVIVPIEDEPFRNAQMDRVIDENCSILFPLMASTSNPFSKKVSDVLGKHLRYVNTGFTRNNYKGQLNEISDELQALITSQKSNFADIMPLERTKKTQDKFLSDMETLKRNQQAIAQCVIDLN